MHNFEKIGEKICLIRLGYKPNTEISLKKTVYKFSQVLFFYPGVLIGLSKARRIHVLANNAK